MRSEDAEAVSGKELIRVSSLDEDEDEDEDENGVVEFL